MSEADKQKVSDPSKVESISVIIPTYQRNDLLARCLGSLSPHVQTLRRCSYQVIVSDDGVDAREVLEDRFPWVLWNHGEKCGPAANRNSGAKLATGDWLAFTDDDCCPEADWLEALVRKIESSGSLVIEGRTYSDENERGPFWCAPSNSSGGMLWSCNMAIRRSLFIEMGGFDVKFPYPHLEDVDFRERLKARDVHFEFCPEASVLHPLRPVGPVAAQARAHESYFYYACKHKLSLNDSGFSLRSFVQCRLSWLRSSRNWAEVRRFTARTGLEALLLAIYTPFWLLKYRLRKGRAWG